ncbi:MAG: SagB/ThcOx family dehydrogenase [Treponema sp.]|nr:SagB/ThcOx family dehydrogenase [Treponema sp.]
MKSAWTTDPMSDTDQLREVPMPPIENAFDESKLIALPEPKTANLKKRDIFQVLEERQSRRKLGGGPISMADLSFLLWACFGKRDIVNGRILRIVPSGGSRHPFETYFYADKVTGLEQGLYRYIATKNSVILVSKKEGLKDELNTGIKGQWFNCAVAIFWVFIPYRCEWRYTHHSHKISLIDVGHIGQNAYLGAEALGIGCCTIGAYLQEIDKVLGVDGENEFCVYAGVFGPPGE